MMMIDFNHDQTFIKNKLRWSIQRKCLKSVIYHDTENG